MKVELTKEQVETIYHIIDNEITRKNKFLAFLEENMKFNRIIDPEITCMSDILKMRMELAPLFETKDILKRNMSQNP